MLRTEAVKSVLFFINIDLVKRFTLFRLLQPEIHF